MSEGETLYLILLVFYLLECGYFAPRGASAFHSAFGKRCRPATSLPIFEGRPGVLRFANPLPPLGRVYVISPPPLSLSPEGIVAFDPAWPGLPPRREQSGKVLPWEAIGEVATVDRAVLINGGEFLRADSREQAARAAAEIAFLKAVAPAKREAAIENNLRRRTDVKAARERLAASEKAGANLSFLSNLLLWLLFLVIPLTAHLYGVTVMWLPALATLLVLTAANLATLWRAHRRLYPNGRTGQRGLLLLRSLAPPALIRAPDSLTLPLMEDFHPVAAAAALLDRDAFEEFAATTLRDLAHPLPPATPKEGAGIVAWYGDRVGHHLGRLARAEGIDPARLLEAPTPRDGKALSCCPRCRAEYLLFDGRCSDCDLPLVPLRTHGGEA
jgi:hypothetical protein